MIKSSFSIFIRCLGSSEIILVRGRAAINYFELPSDYKLFLISAALTVSVNGLAGVTKRCFLFMRALFSLASLATLEFIKKSEFVEFALL